MYQVTQIKSRAWNAPSARVAMLATALSAAALIALHVASPEFALSWRMVSEYANGSHGWLLTCVFLLWSASSIALAVALARLGATRLGKIGLGFLLVAAVGQAMGGLFDINHALHGPAAMIGIPTLCLAAVVLNRAMRGVDSIDAPPTWSAHLPWISFVLMITALVLFMSALSTAGIDMSKQSKPLDALPAGVTGYVGWANRLLFVASYAWVILTARVVITASTRRRGEMS